MTSRTSSHNTALHTLRTAWQTHGKGMILLFIAFLIVITGTGFYRCLPWILPHESAPNQAYTFMDQGFAYGLAVALPVIGVILALSLFSFLFDKRKAMHTLLVGGNRTQFFCVRFLFGALSITAILFVSLLASFLISGLTFGFYALNARNCIYIFLGLTECFLLPYSLTVLLSVLSGRLTEVCVTTLIALLLPEGLALLVRNFSSNFLFGALTNGEFFAETAFTAQSSVSFIKPFGFSNFLPRFCACYSKNMTAEEIAEFYPISYAKLIQYAIIIALFAVAACYLLRKAPMEHAEKINARPYVSFAAAGAAAAVLASFFAWIPNRILSVTVIILSFLLLYFLILSFYRKTFGDFRGFYRVALPASGALLVVVCTFLCGFFGFSSRVPMWTKVESVSITYVGMSYHPTKYSIGGYGNGSYTVYQRVQGFLADLTTDATNDLQRTMRLHTALIANERSSGSGNPSESIGNTVVGANITIHYKMKDNTEMIRTYPTLKLSSLASLLEFDNTTKYRAAISALYTPSDELPEGTEGGIEIRSENRFYISGNTGDNMQQVTLSDADMRALLAAIRKDKKKETAAQRYFPEEDCLGVLYFDESEGFFGALNDHFSTRAYIYARDTNTIAFLREKGFYDIFTRGYTVKGCTVYEMPIVMNEDRFHPVYSRVFQLNSSVVVPDEMSENPITLDGEALTDVIDNARAVYFVKDEGYLLQLRITDADGNWLTVYKFSPKE